MSVSLTEPHQHAIRHLDAKQRKPCRMSSRHLGEREPGIGCRAWRDFWTRGASEGMWTQLGRQSRGQGNASPPSSERIPLRTLIFSSTSPQKRKQWGSSWSGCHDLERMIVLDVSKYFTSRLPHSRRGRRQMLYDRSTWSLLPEHRPFTHAEGILHGRRSLNGVFRVRHSADHQNEWRGHPCVVRGNFVDSRVPRRYTSAHNMHASLGESTRPTSATLACCLHLAVCFLESD